MERNDSKTFQWIFSRSLENLKILLCISKSDNKTSSGHKTLPDKPNDTIGDTIVEENVKKNATESVEEVFLPAEG